MSLSQIKGTIGKRLDSTHIAREKGRKSNFVRYVSQMIRESSKEIIPKTRAMPMFAEKSLPGPEVYSLRAAQQDISLKERAGPRNQSTVSLSLMRGERSMALVTKTKEELALNGHNEIQAFQSTSSLKQHP